MRGGRARGGLVEFGGAFGLAEVCQANASGGDQGYHCGALFGIVFGEALVFDCGAIPVVLAFEIAAEFEPDAGVRFF